MLFFPFPIKIYLSLIKSEEDKLNSSVTFSLLTEIELAFSSLLASPLDFKKFVSPDRASIIESPAVTFSLETVA